MKTPVEHRTRIRSPRSRVLALLALAIGTQTGCGREFYREWANQDVSEAVFEKSRDPRWRLDLFSVEPPALSRFSDPYDPDRPPAPPDDYATEALSPVPQWPDNRLLVPAEGTGYLDMLDGWQRDQPAPAPAPPLTGRTGAPAAGIARPPAPPAAGLPSPFRSPAPAAPAAEAGAVTPSGTIVAPNSGPETAPLTPIPVPNAEPTAPPDVPPPAGPTAPGAAPGRPQAQNRKWDAGVILTAFQQTGLPLPVPAPAAGPDQPVRESPSPRDPVPPIGMDPAPGIDVDLSSPVKPPPGQTRDQYRAGEALASELAGILVPGALDFNEAEAAGLPRNATPYVLTMDQAFTLALINSRVYQFNLENLYISALAVTLQRFAFTPQFYAGISPQTPVGGLINPAPGAVGGGFAGTVFPNSFNYSTRATGQQVSTLNLGTVAGVGKAFSTGGRILAGFANQVVFNFVGKNSTQPRVQSFLPLSVVQPFLRGGGRAVTLEALTQAERNLLYVIRSFAKFRQEFTVQILIGGSITNFGSAVPSLGFSGGGSNDPNIGFINIVEDVQLVENYRKNIAAFEQLVTVYTELVQGEASGLSQLQLDQVGQGLQNAKNQLIQFRTQYRSDLDSFKMQMGLPPDTPLIPDRSLTRPFKDVFDGVDEWQRNPRRDLVDLPKFLDRLPKLQDVVIDGRSALAVYSEERNHEDKLEDLLLAAERTAMEHRLDLMNTRAQLYDAWRQLKYTANALQGVFTVALSNQFVTPPNTTNPFGFVDQAKQFSLVVNAELPLVRLAERNNFRASLIAYQRQRRTLQNTEDSIKLNVRNDMRAMHQAYLQYEIAKKNFILSIRQKDQAFEQIIAPPQGAAGVSQAPLQTTNLINFQTGLVANENALVSQWYGYQIQRLQLYRDIGTLPFDEWEAFHELFPDLNNASGGGYPGAAIPATARAPGPERATAVRPPAAPAVVR